MHADERRPGADDRGHRLDPRRGRRRSQGRPVLTTVYDKLGRAATVTEPAGFVYDSTGQTATTGGTSTAKRRQADGQHLRRLRRPDPGRAGEDADELELHLPLLRQGRPAARDGRRAGVPHDPHVRRGGQPHERRGARQCAHAGGWTQTSYGTPTASADNRVNQLQLRHARPQDRRETRFQILVSVGNVSSRADVTTTYGYDAVGNLTRTTDGLS
jgi:hypothetical protein